MNTKGLRIDKTLAHKLLKEYDSISMQNLYGIDTFIGYSWIGFSREELKNLLSLFVYLCDDGYFEAVKNDHPFIFNYSTDITEMDIVAILEDDNSYYFLDIESKNGDNEEELVVKIKDQIEKRKSNYLPQLLKGKNYITVGFVNNKCICEYALIDGKEIQITDESILFLLVKGLRGCQNQDEYLIQSSNLASIVKLCHDIQQGEYKFYEETNRIYNSLIERIDIDDAYIVYGNAGTGKSVLALKLFFDNNNAKILLMNSKLYFALNFNHGLYYNNQATFNSRCFLKIIDKDTIKHSR